MPCVAPVKRSPQFRDWLSEAVPASGLSKREIARRMAERHPRGVSLETIETGRRTLNKILFDGMTPTQPTRDAIAAALDRDDAPSVADADDEEADLAFTLHALAREQAGLSRRLNRALRAVGA